MCWKVQHSHRRSLDEIHGVLLPTKSSEILIELRADIGMQGLDVTSEQDLQRGAISTMPALKKLHGLVGSVLHRVRPSAVRRMRRADDCTRPT